MLVRFLFVCLIVLSVSGCQQLGPTEIGVRFRSLPPLKVAGMQLGGVSNEVIRPGQLAIVMPWDTIYRFDIAVKDISWPSSGDETDPALKQGMVNTRTLDGNEVALAVTVRYRLLPDEDKIIDLLQRVGSSDHDIREIVVSMARSYMRVYLNQLRTVDFVNEASRTEALSRVRQSMSENLSSYGVEVVAVILHDFRFERALKDGTIDSSYQEKLSEIQKLKEDTERESSRIETIRAKKQQEYNEAQARVNRQVAEADGYKKQAILRGDGYFNAKVNEGKGVLAVGQAEAEGLKQQVEALSGPGGEAILKLQIAKEIMKSKPAFVVVNGGSNGNLQVQKLDTNALLSQIGVIEALSSSKPDKPAPASDQVAK